MIEFKDIREADTHVGGKAYMLGQMMQVGMCVPPGLVLSLPPDAEMQKKVMVWWSEMGRPKLAVRSSACGEDSAELSYAGQQQTFLNIEKEDELFGAIRSCFESADRVASRAYRQHFGESETIAMNVVLQEMISPKYSGVYFSTDPRGRQSEPIIEITDGLGEKLVSGQVNPYRICGKSKNLPDDWRAEWTEAVLDAGERARDLLRSDVDMEWCIDHEGRFWALQARPVTATADIQKMLIEQEIVRLKEKSGDSIWDGQTFSDWTSTISELTFDVWREAFSSRGAFCQAMRELGYLGGQTEHNETILERVFGRAYINLNLLEPLFFGEIPYRIVSTPRPHLQFDPARITAKMVFNTPRPLWRMLRVGWKLRTHRLEEIQRARKALRERNGSPLSLVDLNAVSEGELLSLWQNRKQSFTEEEMKWPFLLTFLIESTLQSLQVLLKRVEGENAKLELQKWLSRGVHTITMEMSEAVKKYSAAELPESEFVDQFGHRGPGEMELSRPRWHEIPPAKSSATARKPRHSEEVSVEERIQRYGKMKGAVVLQEWEILKSLLELREEWKNEVLKPYDQLRRIALELGRRLGVDEKVFWLNSEEIAQGLLNKNVDELKWKAQKRKEKIQHLSKIHLPPVFTLQELSAQLDGRSTSDESVLNGESLSIGLAHGTAVYLDSPEGVDVDGLPDDFVLVTHSIDPGWTPVFSKAKAILTESGGVLSHAAIVAREMGIPAVSQLNDLQDSIPTGTQIWVDGTHGRISVGDQIGNTSH